MLTTILIALALTAPTDAPALGLELPGWAFVVPAPDRAPSPPVDRRGRRPGAGGGAAVTVMLQTADADHRVRITQDDRGRHVVTGCGPMRIWDSFDRAVEDAAARIPAAEAQAAIINSLLPEVP